MKPFFSYLLFSIFLLPFFFSCEQDPLEEIIGDSNINFRESLQKWESLQSSEGNSYVYRARQVFGFGFGTLTKITVQEGEVIERACDFFSSTDQGQLVIDSSYLETGPELGSNLQGAPIRTMDEIYTSCSETYLFADPNRYEIIFDTFEDGILKICGFTYSACRDDCFQGVLLTEFEWI